MKPWAIAILTLIACCATSGVFFAIKAANIHRAETAELRQQLQDLQKLSDSCYEDAQQSRDDWFECQRQKGFEWKEDMELMCSHFKEEE